MVRSAVSLSAALCLLAFAVSFGLPESPLSLEPGNAPVVRMEANPSMGYQLQAATSLTASDWTNIEGERELSAGGILEWAVTPPQPPYFYRVLQRPRLGAKVLQVPSAQIPSGTTMAALGLLASNGFDFMALTMGNQSRSSFFRGAGKTPVLVFKNPTWSDPLILLYFGDYTISYNNYLPVENIAMVSITGPGVSILNKYVELGPVPEATTQFARLSVMNTEEPDLEQQVRDEYILPILEDLQRFSLNLLPVLSDLSIVELGQLIEEGWEDLNGFVNNWTNGIAGEYQADGFADEEDSLLGYVANPYTFISFDGPEAMLNEERDRLDDASDIARQEGDTIQDIKDTDGIVVSEQRYFIRGRVIDNVANFGQPVPGVEIYLFAGPDQTTGSNSDGEFGFLIGPGNYTIEARKPGVGFTYSTSQPFSVEEVLQNPANYTNQGKPIHIEVYQSSYLQADLEIVSITPERRFVGAGETIWFDYEVRNNGSGPNSCDAHQFIFSTDYQCMTSGSCSISGSTGSQNVIIQPGETGVFRSYLTIPSNWVPGDKIYTGGAIYDNCQSPKIFYSPVVQAVICDGNFDTLPASLTGLVLNFNWEETTGAIDPGTSTDFRFFLDGTVNAYDSDTNSPQLSPDSYTYQRNGDTATVTFIFDNTTGNQTVTGTSIYNIILEGKCGGSFTGTVQYTVNNGGFITNVDAGGSGFFLIK
ncbi:MAG: carboxypeptidase regulatory-like domain-containing protein [Puniceicoccaceae bacterium]